MDKFEFQKVNTRLQTECVKVKNPAESHFTEEKIVSRDQFEEEKARLEAPALFD